MSCPYSEEELQKWDSVCNPMGEACYTYDDCDCEHWFGSCEGCEKYEKWSECGGPSKEEQFYSEYIEKTAAEVKEKAKP